MKKVSFNLDVKIHHMFAWSSAYWEALRSDLDRIRILLDQFRFNIKTKFGEELEKSNFLYEKFDKIKKTSE